MDTLLVFLMLLSFSGCVRQNETPVTEDGEISSYSSGSLFLAKHSDSPRDIYIEARDASGKQLKVSSNLKAALGAENFQVVDSPSEAGYILHVNILQEGPVSIDTLKRLVSDGYGSEAHFAGSGAEALLADTLLVQRRVPTEKRPSHARLKNISTRNALESASMRIGVLLPREVSDHLAAREALSINLARALRNALAGETISGAAPHK